MQTHVGYVNHTAAKDSFSMIGVAFEDTTGGALTLEQLISGDITPYECDWDFATHCDYANRIDVYIGNDKYNSYYYLSNGWDESLNEGEGDYFTGWCDWEGYKASVSLDPGDAIWFVPRTGDITFSTPGQVYQGEQTVVVPAGQFQMFANSMPTELDFNNEAQVVYDGLVAEECDWDFATHCDKADRIDVYLGNDKYDSFYYLSNGWDESLNEGEGDYFTGWCDWEGYKPTAKVPVCRGMWAKGTKGAFSIIFNKEN